MQRATPRLDATARTQRARIAALTRWSQHDPVEGTQAARDAFRARFEHEVDPDGVLDPAERSRRAECARKAYYERLSFKSAQARKSKRAESADGGNRESA